MSRDPDPILERLKALHPRAIDLSLDRLNRLLARLGHPERQLPPVIHVAGTNGKGSAVAYLQAIYEASGRGVHAYTSPHLVRFAERFRIAAPGGARDIDEAWLAELLEECEQANEGRSITLFEITTAAGLLAFSRAPADLLLLEVGLGGRLDATNVIERPAATVITPVSIDHVQYLGPTLAGIAREKAGILKPGVLGVIGPQQPEAAAVVAARAAEIGAPLLSWGRDFAAEAADGGLRHVFRGAERRLPAPVLAGAHQYVNAGTAVATALALAAELPVGDAALARGLREARWPARLQPLTRGKLVDRLPPGWRIVLDGGHNPDAGRVVAEAVAGWRRDEPGRAVHLILGMLDTKDPGGYFAHFRGLVDRVRTVAIPGERASLTELELAAAARRAGLAAQPSRSVESALAALLTGARRPATVLIAGSLYLAGSVLKDNG